MSTIRRPTLKPCLLSLCLLACAAGMQTPAWALYKVVGPDGRVSYTDRPPVEGKARALSTSKGGPDTAALPYEVRKAAERFPVVFYSSSTCTPCDSGRALLKSRGIPFRELTVNTGDDVKAYAGKEGTDQLPVLRVGSQQVKGFSAQEWGGYLDAAGYPASSQLPASYNWPQAAPLATPKSDSKPAATDNAGQDAGTAPAAPAEGGATPPGFRF
jgi:glutaredoxin